MRKKTTLLTFTQNQNHCLGTTYVTGASGRTRGRSDEEDNLDNHKKGRMTREQKRGFLNSREDGVGSVHDKESTLTRRGRGWDRGRT